MRGLAARRLVGGSLVVAALLAGLGGRAAAQMDSREGIALQNQILELRRDLQALQAQRGGPSYPPPLPVVRGGSGGSEISAQLLDRVNSLEEEVRRLHGQVDEQANATRRSQDELAKQIADMNFRQQNGGTGAGPGPGPGTYPGPGPGPGPKPLNGAALDGAPVRRPPELAMQEGNAALARRDYPMAEASAREVLANTRGPRSGDAQFLLAQALSGKRDYQGAAIAYDDAYTRAPRGARAPDALVGIAEALLALNDKGAACGSLEKMRAEFPSVRPDVREHVAALRGRAGCR